MPNRHWSLIKINPEYSPKVLRFFRRLCLGWVIVLPFLVPFDSFRNVDLQGLVLLLAGGCAWIVLWLEPSHLKNPWAKGLLALYILFCLIALVATPHLTLNLLGEPHLRLGSLGLIACVGIGLLARKLPAKQLAVLLYALISAAASASIAYAAIRYHGIHRIGGVFNQSDVFACIMGVGILLGWQFSTIKTWGGRLVLISQIELITLLLLSQTRAIIGLIIPLSLIWLYQAKLVRQRLFLVTCLVLLVAIGAALHAIPTSRFSKRSDVAFSTGYRLQLDEAALSASVHRPFFGYGPGNVADALDCTTLKARDLQKTCHDGYYFNSSHNIFLDRVLAFGYIGGLAFAAFVVLALFRYRRVDSFKLAAALIALYYCTNVTSIVVEVVFWTVLLRGFDEKAPTS